MALEPVDRPDHYCRLEVTSRVERRFGNNVMVVEKKKKKNGSGDYYHYDYDYTRLIDDKRAAKSTIAVASSSSALQIGIIPVAPVHLPARYGDNMMLKFANPLVMQSRSKLEGFFKMPYEIGAVSFDKEDGNRPRIIDVISLGLPKYGLYGNPEKGSVCRSYQTELYSDMPEAKIHHEAVGRIRLGNETGSTHTLNKVVFPVEGVDFYFNENRVFFKDVEATIKAVSGKTMLEAKVVDAQWGYNTTGMAQAAENAYTMEWGF